MSSSSELIAAQMAAAAITTENWESISTALITSKADVSYTNAQLALKANQVDLSAANTVISTKADRTYVDAQIASVSDGTPEPLASLAAIIAKYPAGSTYVKLNIADGYVYKWSGTAWVQGWMYQSSGIAENGVTISNLEQVVQTDMYTTSTRNLVNPYKLKSGSMNCLNVSSTSATNVYTEKLAVSEGDKLFFTNDGVDCQVRFVTPLKSDGSPWCTTDQQITFVVNYTVPATVTHVIITYNLSTFPKFAIAKSSPLRVFEPYYIPKLIGLESRIGSVETGASLKANAVSVENIQGHSVQNLFDEATALNERVVSNFNSSTKTFTILTSAQNNNADTRMVSNIVKISKSKKVYISHIYPCIVANGVYDIVCADTGLTTMLYRAQYNAASDGKLSFTLVNTVGGISEYVVVDFSGVPELPDTFYAVFTTFEKGSGRQYYIYNSDTLPTTYVEYGKSTLDWFDLKDKSVETRHISDELFSQLGASRAWEGLIFVYYGDSQTGQNKWQPFVQEKLGNVGVNQGFGGYPVAQVDNSNTGFALASDYRLGQLATYLSTASVVTIMGGTNDFNYDGSGSNSVYNAISIGTTATPYNIKTFKGALAKIIDYISTNYPSVRIVVMSPVGGMTKQTGVNLTTPLVNALGLTLEDFAKAAQEVAHTFGVPFFDVFGRSGINHRNSSMYIEDGIHMNTGVGAKRVAEVVINGLKSIEPY